MDNTPEYLIVGQEGCAKCSYKVRINNFSDLKKGDHLCIDGQHVGCYCFCIRNSLYKHHAIVEKVELIQRSSGQNVESTQQASDCARVHVIEYGQSTDQMKVRKHDYCIDLRLEPLRVWVVRYRSKTFTPEEICFRAETERRLNKADYSLTTNNCEHFSNNCCVGQKESRQVNTMCACLKRSACLGLDLIKLVRFSSLVVIWSSDDLLNIFKKQYSRMMLGVLLLVYFVSTVLTCCGYSVCVCKPALKCCCGRIKCAICLRFVRRVACVKFIVYCFCQVGFFFLLASVDKKFKYIIEVAFGIGCSLITLISLILIRRLMKHWLLPDIKNQKKLSSEPSLSSWEKGDDLKLDITQRKDSIEDDGETEKENVVVDIQPESTRQEPITTEQEDPAIHTHILETEHTKDTEAIRLLSAEPLNA